MGTRCSVRLPAGIWIGSGAGLAAWPPAGAGADVPAGAPITSALVTRPSRPLPCSDPVSTPFSAAIFLADGEADWAPACAGVTAAALAATFAGTTASFSDDFVVAVAVVSITASTSPLVTLSPSFLTIFTSTPSLGAGVSSTTLSVSMSTRFSSRLTASPGFLRHETSVASDTDSESCGTFTSTCMAIFP